MPLPGILVSAAGKLASLFSDKEKPQQEVVKDKKDTSALTKNIDMSSVSAGEKEVIEAVPDVQTEATIANEGGKIDYTKPLDTENMTVEQIKAVQREIGTKDDGKWGAGSMQKLSDYYRDKGIDPPNAKALTNVFNEMGFGINTFKGNTGRGANYHFGGEDFKYGANEVGSGGEVTPELVASVKDIMGPMKLEGVTVTAANDAYHHSDEYYAARTKNYKTRKNDPKFKNMTTAEAAEWGRKNLGASGHTKGNKIDFVVKDVGKAREAFKKQGFKQSGKWWIKDLPNGKKVKILDEYKHKTSGGTGGHFDWGVY